MVSGCREDHGIRMLWESSSAHAAILAKKATVFITNTCWDICVSKDQFLQMSFRRRQIPDAQKIWGTGSNLSDKYALEVVTLVSVVYRDLRYAAFYIGMSLQIPTNSKQV